MSLQHHDHKINQHFRSNFSQDETLLYCYDINRIMEIMEITFDSFQWRLFIDFDKISLKVVLLYDGHILPSIYLAHAVDMKQTHKNKKLL